MALTYILIKHYKNISRIIIARSDVEASYILRTYSQVCVLLISIEKRDLVRAYETHGVAYFVYASCLVIDSSTFLLTAHSESWLTAGWWLDVWDSPYSLFLKLSMILGSDSQPACLFYFSLYKAAALVGSFFFGVGNLIDYCCHSDIGCSRYESVAPYHVVLE